MKDLKIVAKYDSERSSNASMAYVGTCAPEATEKDIRDKLGEGSFGYNCMRTSPTTFIYKKWTD